MEVDRGAYRASIGPRLEVRSAAATVVYLTGGLVVAFVAAIAADNVPLHIHELLNHAVAALVLVAVMAVFSVRWARKMAEINGLTMSSRAVRAAGLSYPVVLTATALALGAGELLFGLGVPIHVLYGILFVPASAAVVGVVSLAWGRALGSWQLGGRLAIRAAPIAGLAFFLAYLLMDVVGYRVGAPGAEEVSR